MMKKSHDKCILLWFHTWSDCERRLLEMVNKEKKKYYGKPQTEPPAMAIESKKWNRFISFYGKNQFRIQNITFGNITWIQCDDDMILT